MNFPKKWFLLFGLRSVLAFFAFYVLFFFLEKSNALLFFQLIDASIVFSIMHVFYSKIFLDGIVLGNLVVSGQYSSFSISVDAVCSSFVPIALFSSLCIGLPRIPSKKRLVCLAIGLVTLFALNILRLVFALFTAAIFDLEVFDFVHLVLFKVDMAFFVLALFGLCLVFVIRKNLLLASVNASQ